MPKGPSNSNVLYVRIINKEMEAEVIMLDFYNLT